MQDFVCPLQGQSLPQSCGSPGIKSYWPSESDSLEIPSPFAGLEAWHEAQNLHTSGRTFLVLLFSSFLVSHLTGMGFIFIVLEHLLRLIVVSSLCLDVGHPFLACSRVLLCMVVQQLVAISLLHEEIKCMSFYSSILNQKLSQNFDIWPFAICWTISCTTTISFIHHHGHTCGWDLNRALITRNRYVVCLQIVWFSKKDF